MRRLFLLPSLALLPLACVAEPVPVPEPTPPPEPCDFAPVLSVERSRGAFPLPLRARVEDACGDSFEVSWVLGDGTEATGGELEHTIWGAGTFAVEATAVSGDVEVVLTAEIEVLRPECPLVGEPRELGTTSSGELDEASGLMVGRADANVLWSHNDSGDDPRLFAFNTGGEHLGIFPLEGAPDGDWEDSTIGVGDDGIARLYVGDIGDNAHDRDEVLVHMFPEPSGVTADGGSDQGASVGTYDTLRLIFPESTALDSEALLFDPVHGDLLLVGDDDEGDTAVYRKRAPHDPGAPFALEHVADIDIGAKPTGGGFSPDGAWMIVRTQDAGFLWIRDRTRPLAHDLAEAPCDVPLPSEERGEGLDFAPSGEGFYTVSEEVNQPVHFVPVAPPEQPCDGLEAQIVADPEGSGPAPFTPTLSVGTECVFEELTSVRWDLGDGNVLEEESISPTFTRLGSHTVRLDLEDATGATASAEYTFEVTPQICPTYGEVEEWGTVTADAVVEASGLAHSRLTPGVLWTHNDSGSGPELFALGEDGRLLGTWTLQTDPRDWEDIATGWNDAVGGHALYVGDVGDNAEQRDDIKIFIVPEPAVDTAAEEVEEDVTDFGTMTLTYPDGPHNCESIFIDPWNDDLVVVTKDGTGRTFVFRKPGPHDDGDEFTLELVTELDFANDPFSGSRSTTAADVHPDGRLIAVRTYSDLWIFRRGEGQPLADVFNTPEPCDAQAPQEQQGEAVTFSADGSGYILLSEGDMQPIYYRDVIPIPAR